LGRNLSHKRNSVLELSGWWLQVSPNTRETKESIEVVEVSIKRSRKYCLLLSCWAFNLPIRAEGEIDR
jgi:hypothetical protein